MLDLPYQDKIKYYILHQEAAKKTKDSRLALQHNVAAALAIVSEFGHISLERTKHIIQTLDALLELSRQDLNKMLDTVTNSEFGLDYFVDEMKVELSSQKRRLEPKKSSDKRHDNNQQEIITSVGADILLEQFDTKLDALANFELNRILTGKP